VTAGGPYFDELERGQRFDTAPALTLTEGHAALHQAIVGDRLRLPLDATLSERVLNGRLAHPALVCDVSIGQSTLATQRVIGNLFYRGLVLRRSPLIGDTLHTTTEIVALRQTSPKPDRPATGLAVLRIRTTDQHERRVLDYWRCAMLPLRDPEGRTRHDDDLAAIPAELDPAALRTATQDWDLSALPKTQRPDNHARWQIEGGDVVGAAPELARLSLNIATAHHDAKDGRRLVYGGHTIGLAASQATRALPDLLTIVAWHSCDHLGPVYEGDTLHSELELERLEPLPDDNGALAHLRSRVRATGEREVLDWRFVGVLP
jgi:acyl dehydratase